MSTIKHVIVEYNEEKYKLQLEQDGTLSLDTLKGCIHGADGLFFIGPEGIKEFARINNGKIYIDQNVNIYEVRVCSGI